MDTRGDEEGSNRGLITLIRKGINAELVEENNLAFGQFQTFKIFQHGSKKILFHLTNIYINNGNPRNVDWAKVEQLINSYEDHCITGDFNCQSNSFGFTNSNQAALSRGEKLNQVLDSCNAKVINTGELTRIPDTENTRPSSIDLTIVTDKLLLETPSWVVHNDSLGSDHIPQIIKFNFRTINEFKGPSILKFKTENADWNGFKLDYLKNKSQSTNVDIGEKTKTFTDKVILAGMNNIPNNSKSLNRTATNKKEFIKTYSWWNKDCALAKTKRNFWHKRYISSQNYLHHVELKDAQKNLNKTMKEAQNKSFAEHLGSLNTHSNPKETWDKLKVLDGKIKSSTIKCIKDATGAPLFDDKLKANVIGKQFHFISSDENTPTEFIPTKKHLQTEPFYKNQDELDDKIYNQPFNMSELNRVLASKKKRSAAGEDALTYNMLNNLPSEGKEELLGIFNSIWEKGDIPKTFKTAIVIPIVKPDQPEDAPSSYRPIALTSHVGKTLEALVSNRLNKYLETNNLLNKNQAGFRNKRQALEMIAKLEMEVREAQNTKQEVISAFIDISKAFDQCSREIVLKHLKEAKVTGQMYNYVQNFLKDRVFKVKVGNELSETLIQENGIPQGSIISPTLFLLSINKVNEQITKSTSLGQFADDTAIWKRYSISRRSRESAIGEFEKATIKRAIELQLQFFLHDDSLKCFLKFTCFENIVLVM